MRRRRLWPRLFLRVSRAEEGPSAEYKRGSPSPALNHLQIQPRTAHNSPAGAKISSLAARPLKNAICTRQLCSSHTNKTTIKMRSHLFCLAVLLPAVFVEETIAIFFVSIKNENTINQFTHKYSLSYLGRHRRSDPDHPCHQWHHRRSPCPRRTGSTQAR